MNLLLRGFHEHECTGGTGKSLCPIAKRGSSVMVRCGRSQRGVLSFLWQLSLPCYKIINNEVYVLVEQISPHDYQRKK